MNDESPGGPTRLRGAGIGSIVGGFTLGLLSIVIPYVPASAATAGLGIVAWVLNHRQVGSSTGIGLGCTAVGVIGLFEALGFGLGIGPLFIAIAAVGAGLIDLFVGGALGRSRTGG